MIEEKDLSERAQKKLEISKARKDGYGSDTVPMFNIDGSFNKSNWNGGDSIIRQYTSYLEYEKENEKESKEFIFNNGKGVQYEGALVASYGYLEDYNYVQIVAHYVKYDVFDECSDWKTDQYLIKWYKRRGTTDTVNKNGKPINKKQYIRLLNFIEGTGFKFEM